MKKVILFGTVAAGTLVLQNHFTKDPAKKWVKSPSLRGGLLIASLVGAAYLFVK